MIIIKISYNIQGCKDIEKLSFSYTNEKIKWQNNSEVNTYQKPFRKLQKLRNVNSASRNLFEEEIKNVTVIILLQGYKATTLYNDINTKWLKLFNYDKLCCIWKITNW